MLTKFNISGALVSWSCLIVSGLAVAAPEEKTQLQPLPSELRYTSSLTNYKGYTDQAVQSWRGANDRVGQVGGWRAYAKEMAEQPTSNAQPAANPHAGHHEGTKR